MNIVCLGSTNRVVLLNGTMFSSYIIFAASVLIFITPAYAGKYNVSYGDLTTCREFDIDTRGYSYADFFHLSSLNNSKSNNEELLHLKLYVITSMDAHILLSEGNVVKRDDRVYEIVLGAGANTFSVIRSKLSRDQAAIKTSPNILSALDPTPVEIVQTKDGTLLVIIPNFAEPFMKYVDANPLNITHISFSSYGLTKAKWFYDCAFDGFSEEMQIETKPLTDEERLTADVLSASDEEFPPPGLTQIAFSFKVRSVEFDHETSLLHTRLHFSMNWTDSRLAWDPKNYSDVKSLVQPMFKIWHPQLSITEGAMNTFEKFDPFYSVRLESTGFVQMFAPNAELHSWCFAASKDWPNDMTKCNLTLTVRDNGIKIAYDTKSSLASEAINELSEWKINKVAVILSSGDNKTADYDENNNSGNSLYLQLIEDGLFIQLTISRNSEFYQCAFLAPALGGTDVEIVFIEWPEGLILLSFFLEEHRRGGLNLVSFIVLSIGLMVLVLHAPKGVLSHIVLLYDILLKISTATYILHIATIWLELYPPKMKPPGFVTSVINCSPLRYVLAMRQQNSSEYLESLEYPWREVSKIINRIIFIALLITFACIF